MDEPSTDSAAASTPPPLRSAHTSSFAQILDELGISVLVTTYQAGKLVALRNENGVVNTHFRDFRSPMGLAADQHRLAIGTPNTIWEFHNVPAVTRQLEPAGRHDACYLPHSSHVTGNILVHEMAWGNSPSHESTTGVSPGERAAAVDAELWIVNTRFSCLCTLDRTNSFVPHWRPPFVSVLVPEDRCHLNGVALVNGRPKYVTAHGTSDEPAGWRQHKAHGGVVLDVESNEIVVRDLAMPHSPRWYQGRLWLLESGSGTIGTIDLARGRYEPLAELHGFTRGLDFCGPYAFVGLSQVRESAVFSGIPITERLQERNCGVWIVDLRNGETVALLKFEDALQEIFAVQVLPGIRFPEILTDHEVLIADSFVLPDDALRDVPHEIVDRGRKPQRGA